MTAKTPRILVFDSGVGGLSIVSEIRALLPGLAIDYLADNAFFPYGTKSERELKARVLAVIDTAISRTQPDLIVIGCNSASTIALESLRSRFRIPFVGVVPAIKPAAQASHSKTIGLLATEGTIMRDYTRALAREFAHDCHLVSCGSSELVVQAEKLVRGEAVERDHIRHELERLWAQPGAGAMDVVVLGCTHFPLLKPLLNELAPQPVQWVDSGAAIARRVCTLLPAMRSDQPSPRPDTASPDTAFFTASFDTALCRGIRHYGFDGCALLQA